MLSLNTTLIQLNGMLMAHENTMLHEGLNIWEKKQRKDSLPKVVTN